METAERHPYPEAGPTIAGLEHELVVAREILKGKRHELDENAVALATYDKRVEVLNAENRALQAQASSLSKKVMELQKLRTDIDSLAATWSHSTAVGAVEVRAVLRSLQVTP
jgi:chromosome segregation ATPase